MNKLKATNFESGLKDTHSHLFSVDQKLMLHNESEDAPLNDTYNFKNSFAAEKPSDVYAPKSSKSKTISMSSNFKISQKN